MRHEGSLTKIIATTGPATSDINTLRKMFEAGVDVCRLNFSHGSHDDHKKVIQNIRQLNKEFDTHVSILGDLQGPKLRTGDLEKSHVELITGETIIITTEKILGNEERVSISYKDFAKDVEIGEEFLIDDGKLKLKIIETDKNSSVKAVVIAGGTLKSRKGVNLPNTKLSLPSLTEKDIDDFHFAVENNIDWLALSFVRSATDIIELRDLIKSVKSNIRIIAKIEKPEALNEIEDIIDLSNAVMIARGDLGVEVPFHEVPLIQKRIINKCLIKSKPVIIATQMMESMIENFQPTRAEANDVANAVLDGTDAVMLSGETSVGKYPVDAIKNMQKIIDSTAGVGMEKQYNIIPSDSLRTYLPDSICYNASNLAKQIKAKAIIIHTYSGYTAMRISSHRPKSDIFAFTTNDSLLSQLPIVWGVRSFKYENFSDINDFVQYSTEVLSSKELIEPGDFVIHVSSIPLKEKGHPNMIKLSMV